MSLAKRVGAASVLLGAAAFVLAGCSTVAPVFADEGVADAATPTFHLAAGAYRIAYDVADRDPPGLPCRFSVSLMRQPSDDPLAPGTLVADSEPIQIPIGNRATGEMTVRVGQQGSHYLQIRR